MRSTVPVIHHSSFIVPRYKKAQPGGLSALEAALADVENCDL
jgi:hypothetical protein